MTLMVKRYRIVVGSSPTLGAILFTLRQWVWKNQKKPEVGWCVKACAEFAEDACEVEAREKSPSDRTLPTTVCDESVQGSGNPQCARKPLSHLHTQLMYPELKASFAIMMLLLAARDPGKSGHLAIRNRRRVGALCQRERFSGARALLATGWVHLARATFGDRYLRSKNAIFGSGGTSRRKLCRQRGAPREKICFFATGCTAPKMQSGRPVTPRRRGSYEDGRHFENEPPSPTPRGKRLSLRPVPPRQRGSLRGQSHLARKSLSLQPNFEAGQRNTWPAH
ncbi:hypothetical protein PGT21_010508 [Puccinia graminis f. sp. tritici]|uniref:Uncharacterized protein n=1 Tax=Puccinia graminis f. sp. tritici TaxID=56615 RepID=A0A5B0P900_PUCGR|nr:hypothetical protein PGT21_010508 [Puccinia graminis f. sp. tritici]KAA1134093.1 hypothetical protein PGTUg99_025958 [Puccinia graminis f. sp. tritici]